MKLLTDEKPITMAQSLFNDKWLAENMFRIIDEKAGQGLKEIEKKAVLVKTKLQLNQNINQTILKKLP